MVRKQLYIRPDQNRALKERARELGITEAALMRQAVDAFLAPDRAGPDADLEAFLKEAEQVAANHRLSGRFERAELYDRVG